MKYLSILLIVLVLQASDVIIKDEECTINWTKYTLTCVGISEKSQSKYAAYTSAKIIAQRNLLQFLKGVKITSTTTIENGMLKSDIIKATVKGVVKGARVVKSVYHNDGSASVYVKVYLIKDILAKLFEYRSYYAYNFFTPFLLNASVYSYKDIKTLKKILNDLKIREDKIGVNLITEIINKIKKNKYTGIIVDATGVKNFDMALMPKIRDKNGKEIYPSNLITQDVLTSKNGAVTYEIGLEDAKKNKKVYSNPIIIKAKGIYGKKTSDLVIESKELIIQNKELLKQAKIIILVDVQ